MTAYCLQLPAAGMHLILSNSRDKVRATATTVSFAAQHLHLLGQGFGTHMHRSYIAHAGTQMRDPLFVGRPKQPNTKRWRRLGTVGAGNDKKRCGKKAFVTLRL